MERNALRAHLVERAEHWRWGSLWRRELGQGHTGLRMDDGPVVRPSPWVEWVNAAETDAELRVVRQSVRGRKGDRLLFGRRPRATASPQRGLQAQGGRDGRLPVCRPEGLLPIHAGAQRGEFMIKEGLIDPREPLGGYFDRSGLAQMRESQARPGPVSRVLDQPRADRIAEYVAKDCEKMAVLLNRKTFEAALPHMPMASVVAMVAADVAGHPPLHERAKGGGGGRLHDEVKMIGHQADAEELDGIFGFRGGEQVEARGVIAVLVEDRGATVPTIEHMVGVSGHLSARNPRHTKRTVRETGAGPQEKVACPLFLPPPVRIRTWGR